MSTLDTRAATAHPSTHAPTLTPTDALADRPQLRLVVAGSVDDGKSTLVGRLLFDTKSILVDTYDAIEAASRRRGADAVDLALLTDGLRAEREQGITIDVAYRYFSTPNRSFILADTPGHTQYTRNTVTGASTADAALLLVDVRNGALVQTRRHAALMALLKVPHLVVAINKMDAVAWSRDRFEEVAAQVRATTMRLGHDDVSIVPVSALTGQNIVTTGGDDAGSWYTGPSLLEQLESLDVADEGETLGAPFRMPVQLVLRPRTAQHPDYRGLAGRITSGRITVGDPITALPTGLSSAVVGIDSPRGPLTEAGAGESVTLLLADELDVGRGEVLSRSDETSRPSVTTDVLGVLCWLDERPGRAGARVLVKAGARTTRAILTSVGEHWNVDDQQWQTPVPAHASDVEEFSQFDAPAPRDVVELNEIVRVGLRLSEPVAVDDYTDLRDTGGFLVIDQATGATLAAGMIGDPLTRAFDPGI